MQLRLGAEFSLKVLTYEERKGLCRGEVFLFSIAGKGALNHVLMM